MAQLFTFMSIGVNFLTTSLTVLLVDIASNPVIRDKVQTEIDGILNKYKRLDLYSLQQLKYLDAVIQESLRMNPGFFGVVRTCSSSYTLPRTDLILEKGTTVMIPICGIQMDPNNYPDPDVFNPDRFIDHNYKSTGTYFPFGAGPRICLVYRLVILMLKMAVAKVLKDNSLRMSPRARLPLRFQPTLLAKLDDQLWLQFESRMTSE